VTPEEEAERAEREDLERRVRLYGRIRVRVADRVLARVEARVEQTILDYERRRTHDARSDFVALTRNHRGDKEVEP
jgi:hypothetical protein